MQITIDILLKSKHHTACVQSKRNNAEEALRKIRKQIIVQKMKTKEGNGKRLIKNVYENCFNFKIFIQNNEQNDKKDAQNIKEAQEQFTIN